LVLGRRPAVPTRSAAPGGGARRGHGLDTSDAVKEADTLLGTLTGGRVVITSRLANFAGHFDPFELDVLGVADAVAFLLERTERRRHRTPDDAETAGLLAEDLGGLALALEQAGAYVAKHGIFDQLTPAGRRLLERLAWLAPEPVPGFLLEVPVTSSQRDSWKRGYHRMWPTSRPGFLLEVPVKSSWPATRGLLKCLGRFARKQWQRGTNSDPADTLTNLADYSLARWDPEHQEFSVHRLVQDATRRGLAENDRQRSLGEAIAWLETAFTSALDVWPRPERLHRLMPHVADVINHALGARINPDYLWYVSDEVLGWAGG
jgi:hypothetical protein